MEEIIEKLKEWVNKNYDPYACGFTPQRSEGNYYDLSLYFFIFTPINSG